MKYSRHYFPQKRPPQNVWPSEIFLSPRKCYTTWSRHYFPQKRPPQNVWPSKIFLSPRKCYTEWARYYFPHKRPPQEDQATLLSCQLAFLAEASKNVWSITRSQLTAKMAFHHLSNATDCHLIQCNQQKWMNMKSLPSRRHLTSKFISKQIA